MNKYYEYEELERLFGGNSRIQATLEQTCHFAGKDSEPENARFVFGNKESLLGHVVQRAKEPGTWIEKIDDYVKQMIGNGQEKDLLHNTSNIIYPVRKCFTHVSTFLFVSKKTPL